MCMKSMMTLLNVSFTPNKDELIYGEFIYINYASVYTCTSHPGEVC